MSSPACAHLYVMFALRAHDDGTRYNSWACLDCGCRFAPVLVAQRPAREVLAELDARLAGKMDGFDVQKFMREEKE